MRTTKIYSDQMVDEQDPQAVLDGWLDRVETAFQEVERLQDQADLHPETWPVLRERVGEILHRINQEGRYLLKIYAGDGRERDD